MINITLLRKRLLEAHRRYSGEGGGWRKVGSDYSISGAMAYRIANSDYEPREPHVRIKLGLPAYAPAPVCAKCGRVHVTKRCTMKTQPRRWVDYPLDLLRLALEQREEY